MNNFLKQALRLFVQTLQCNVSTGLILLLLSFHAPAFSGLNDGLVAYWHFDNSKENK